MQSIKANFGLGKMAILVIVVLWVAAALTVISGLPVNNGNSTSSSTGNVASDQSGSLKASAPSRITPSSRAPLILMPKVHSSMIEVEVFSSAAPYSLEQSCQLPP